MNRFLDSYFAAQAPDAAAGGHLPTLEDLVGEYVKAILALTHHNISQTARILNISRTTLYSRIRRQSS